MSLFGMITLLMAFTATTISVATLLVGHVLKNSSINETLSWAGRTAAIVSFVALTLSCGVLVYSFLIGNVGIQYVLDNRVTTSGALGTLYRISGLWAGREGSLLFWAWLVSLFGMLVSARRMNNLEPLDNMASFIMQLVLVAFLGVLMFSPDNIPFTATDSSYFNEDGSLTSAAQMKGMNSLLQHWAMAIHPPMLFLGYAGLAVPFAYAIATCIVGRTDKEWVLRSERYALTAWMFLTLGIGLGAVWAYVVLGWGGYWGWDPVENASLLPWLVTVALIHSFTVYKNRGMFKGWAVISASLAFSFCIVGTFISRSGLVQSVHAFEGDAVSLVLFGALIVVSILMGIIGFLVRRKDFAKDSATVEAESMLSKDGAYFVNNVVMTLMAFLLAYLTIAQALPSWLPFGGSSVASASYEVVARPLGVAYLLMMAVCPLLGWIKTDPGAFLRKARIPGVCALVLFALLALYWAKVLLPTYQNVIAAGGSTAEALAEQGPAFYYNGLALFAFLVASLLVFNSVFQLVRIIKRHGRNHTGASLLVRLSGSVSHFAMGIILIGLVGSAMYVTEVNDCLTYDQDSDTYQSVTIKDYELSFKSADAHMTENHQDVEYVINLDVNKGGNYLGTMDAMITLVGSTQQQKYSAGVISLPQEDLFVVYQGASDDKSIYLDLKVNPLITLVWVGLGLLVLGMFMSLLGWRNPHKGKGEDPDPAQNEETQDEKAR